MPVHDWTRVDEGVYHDLHLSWNAALLKALNGGLLPSDYYALTGCGNGPLRPDPLNPAQPAERLPEAGDLGELTAADLPEFAFRSSAFGNFYVSKRRTLRVHRATDHQVVSLIEIVSPGNKKNRHNFESFLQRVTDCIDHGYHLLVVDLFPPGPRDPNGIHGAIWGEIADQPFEQTEDLPLTLVSYFAGATREAFIEPFAVGSPLLDMPLFLNSNRFVSVPLEATYLDAYAGVPRHYREILEAE
jgi:hypothetical protein